jgi:hypothetical protein
MLNTKKFTKNSKALVFSKKSDKKVTEIILIIHGQGVFLFNTSEETSFTFYNSDKTDGLKVILNSTEFYVTRLSNSNQYKSQTKKGGLTSKSGAYYWFSLDSQNQCLQGGVGEPRIETMCYNYQFDHADKLWEANKSFMESLVTICLSDTITPLKILKDPITKATALLIKGTDELTMDDVAGTEYLPSGALSTTSQILYNCVSGKKFTLNTPKFPNFTDAIEYSIKTPGMWCNTRLKEKATEFGNKPNPLETYLRITLGQNNGESPGIPYVMEIWPIGHYSPIHNHSSANAIIRVLNGSINVSLYPFLCDDPESVQPFSVKNFNEGDITWITPNLNQVHMLRNLNTNKKTCITIQCYMYDETDTVHYDYFDYLRSDDSKNQYEPDSDMDFYDFKNKMMEEWNNRENKKRK